MRPIHTRTPAQRTQRRGIVVIAALFLICVVYFASSDRGIDVDVVEVTNRAFDDGWESMNPAEQQKLCEDFHNSDGATVERTANTIAREHNLTVAERDQVRETFHTRYIESC